MAERTSYAPGTPSWVDLGSPDIDGAAAFYGALLRLDVRRRSRPDAGGYGMFTLRGKNVAGLGPADERGHAAVLGGLRQRRRRRRHRGQGRRPPGPP